MQRMAYDLPQAKRELENEPLSYEKIKWPTNYKDLIFKRKNISTLPQLPKHIPKLVGLKKASGLTQDLG